MISSKKVFIEPKAGVSETKICPKLPKGANILIYNPAIQILFRISTYFCVSQRKHVMGYIFLKTAVVFF